MLQATIFDGLSFDPFALFDDRWSPAEVGVGGGHVVQALVVSPVVVVLDEGLIRRHQLHVAHTKRGRNLEQCDDRRVALSLLEPR